MTHLECHVTKLQLFEKLHAQVEIGPSDPNNSDRNLSEAVECRKVSEFRHPNIRQLPIGIRYQGFRQSNLSTCAEYRMVFFSEHETLHLCNVEISIFKIRSALDNILLY
jgi:hypothetical protein